MRPRHTSKLCIAIAVLAFVGRVSAQTATYVCDLYGELDCQGEVIITVNALTYQTCLDWLAIPTYSSFLLNPDGEATCVNQAPLPVELTSFLATASRGTVHLTWTTASETDNAGFEIEHRRQSGDFEQIGFVPGSGTSREAQGYRYDVEGLEPDRHVFRLKQVDFDGSFAYSAGVEVFVTVPNRFVLAPAYPNPFNPTSTVRFSVAVEQEVVLRLMDGLGRQVRILFEGRVPANETRSVSIDGSGLPSGSYHVTLTGRDFSGTVGVELVK